MIILQQARGNLSSGDQLALDLQFAADKTLTARKGPTPTFTRASSGTFVGSNGLVQTAGNNVARFDHDPVTLASRGLLIEESRTNTFQRSEDFTQAIWTKTNVTVTGDNATSPDGNNTADSIFETAINSGHRIQYGSSIAAGTYSASVYVKRVGGRNVNLEFVSGGSGAYANFNLQTATVTLSGAYGTGFTFISASITNAGNNWFRISLVATTPVSTSQLLIQILDGNNNSYLGDVTKGVQLWGAQLEAGSFATSYIPTTTASVVRSADVCSISGVGFTGMWNALEGSMLFNSIYNSPISNSQRMWEITDGTTNNFIRSFRAITTNFPDFRSTSGGSTNVTITGSTALQPNQPYKHSCGFKTDDYVFYVNNAQIGTDNLGAMPISPNVMYIGMNSPVIGAGQLNGTISAIRYYRKRLPNAKLQTLTV